MPLTTPRETPSLIVPWVTMLNPAAAAWPAANRALFSRFELPEATALRYVNWLVGTQSGNVQMGVVRLTGADWTSYTRVMDSGAIACPAVGDVRSDLGATLLPAGVYAAFLWADNTTVQVRTSSAAGLTTHRVTGLHSSLAGGVAASGTLAWTSAYCALTVER